MNIKALIWLLEFIERTDTNWSAYAFLYEELGISLRNASKQETFKHYIATH